MFPPEHTDKGLQRLIEEMPMIAKSKAGQPGSPKPYQSNDAEERIRRRAYELYEQRGRVTASPWTTGSKRNLRFR
jgi:hypothetical protein